MRVNRRVPKVRQCVRRAGVVEVTMRQEDRARTDAIAVSRRGGPGNQSCADAGESRVDQKPSTRWVEWIDIDEVRIHEDDWDSLDAKNFSSAHAGKGAERVPLVAMLLQSARVEASWQTRPDHLQ